MKQLLQLLCQAASSSSSSSSRGGHVHGHGRPSFSAVTSLQLQDDRDNKRLRELCATALQVSGRVTKPSCLFLCFFVYSYCACNAFAIAKYLFFGH
jgi:hypothetical protein